MASPRSAAVFLEHDSLAGYFSSYVWFFSDPLIDARVQKIRTLEMDGKTIKLQIVSD